MKKRLAVVLAAIMMLSCTTVLAAPSIQTDVAVDNVVASDGSTVTVTADTSANATTELTQNLEAATDEVAESVVVTGEAEVEVEVVAMVKLTGTVPTNGSVDVTVEVNGVTAGEEFTVAHKKTSGAWETLRGVSNANGKVTIEGITEFSPFYIAKVTVTPVAPAPAPQPEADKEESTLPPYNPNVWPWNEIIAREEAAKAAQNAADATLPKTGAVAVLPVAAMACLAGAVVCGRKEK